MYILPALAGGKNLLDTGLGVVKIALNGAYTHIGALLGHHLSPLYLGNTAVGVEDADGNALHILEAFQSGFTRIAGGGGEDHQILMHTFGLSGCGQKLGQHGKSHVLKGGGGAMEQLQHGEGAHGNGGRQILCRELAGVGLNHQLFHVGNVRQEGGEDLGCHTQHILFQAGGCIEGRQLFGHIKATVGGQTGDHGLGTVHSLGSTAGRVVSHRSNFSLILRISAQIPSRIRKILGF